AAECLKCHVTAAGADAALLGKKYKLEDGVGCESCHGAGDEYKSMKIMKDHDASVAAGMVVPNAETCTACHNEGSPTFAGFDFDEYYAKIAHEIPSE
ncbi:cytochrome C554, partial [bacterium]